MLTLVMRRPSLLFRRLAFRPLAIATALWLAGPAWQNARAIEPAATPHEPAAPAEPTHPQPHPSNVEVKSELTSVIDEQLAAFRAGDYAKAYTFAAAGIKGMFTTEEFEGMVRKGYPAIARSTSVDYGMSFDTGEDAVIYVRVLNAETKADGQYQYLLKKENGVWKIGGVAEVKPTGLSV